MNGLIFFIVLIVGFVGVLYYGKKLIKAWHETCDEIHFKCRNSNNCNKKCGQFCRTFGDCEMCEADNCGKCILNQHRK